MKRFALFILASVAWGQTQIPQAMVKPPAVTAPTIQVLTPTGIVNALIDNTTLILDQTGPTPILRAVAPVKLPQIDGFTVTTPTQVFTASKPLYTGAAYTVYRSGSRMKLTADYTVSGQTITFTSGQTIQAGESIVIVYLPLN